MPHQNHLTRNRSIRAGRILSCYSTLDLVGDSEAQEVGRAALALAPVPHHATLFVMKLLWPSSPIYSVLLEARKIPLTSLPLGPSVSYLVPVDQVSG